MTSVSMLGHRLGQCGSTLKHHWFDIISHVNLIECLPVGVPLLMDGTGDTEEGLGLGNSFRMSSGKTLKYKKNHQFFSIINPCAAGT